MAKHQITHPIALLLHVLDEAYNHPAWHGTTLRGSVRGLTAAQASWRPGRGRHNIWELMLHAAYWKYAVRRRILGGKRGSFLRKGSNWFACPGQATPTEKAWRADVALLDAEHRKLRAAVASLAPGALGHFASGKTLHRHIAGIALHDVYHTGQIQVLKRLQKRR